MAKRSEVSRGRSFASKNLKYEKLIHRDFRLASLFYLKFATIRVNNKFSF